jgi:chemotaxis protein CheZ
MGNLAADPANAAIDDLRGNLTATAATLLQELEEVGRVIANARAEVIALRAEGLDDSAIPTATDELAAIVQHTAQATHEIIDTCEQLETLAGQVPQAADALFAATTRIYEACAFQDITGQRIAKVVTALQTIENRIGKARMSMASENIPMPPQPPPPPPPGDGLLNGPQMPGAAISQSAIDALFD